MPKKILLQNCRHYLSPADDPVSIFLKDGKITEIGKHLSVKSESIQVIDAKNLIVAPGFIDIHIQGAGGYDILDASKAALRTMAQTLAHFGTTGFLATTVFQPGTENLHLEIAAQMTDENCNGAKILGIHLEGPFINPLKKGGIADNSICSPSAAALKEILSLCKNKLTMMTLAPELDGIRGIMRILQEKGVILAFGHSDADYHTAKNSFHAISHVTHLFNAMNPMHHREPGPIPAIFESVHVTAQLIADGVHVHPAMVNLTYRIMGSSRIICITDGVKSVGLPAGEYVYNGKKYRSENGTARYLDGTLIGTSVSLNEIVKLFQKFTNCSLAEAIHTATRNPAKLLGLENQKGTLQTGADADIILMDDNFEIFLTIVGGEIVFQNFLI